MLEGIKAFERIFHFIYIYLSKKKLLTLEFHHNICNSNYSLCNHVTICFTTSTNLCQKVILGDTVIGYGRGQELICPSRRGSSCTDKYQLDPYFIEDKVMLKHL